MLNDIIRYSIRNKLVVGLFVLALLGWGSWSVTQLPIDAVPDITNNQVQVITSSPSLGAPDIERLITFPVEVSLNNIPGLIEIRSFSRFGLSIVTVVFTDETDIYWARQQIAERLQTVATQIPPGVGQPVLGPVTTGLGEIFQYSVVAKPGYESRYSLTELRTLQDWVIRRGLLGTPGVADVSAFGGERKQYEIAADPARLRAMNLTISDVFTALERNNQNTGGAYIDKKPNAYFIRSEGLLGSTTDIANVLIRLNGEGLPVRISDVATVGMGSAVRYGAVTRNGTGETVGAVVMMLKGENSSAVIKRVKVKIEEISRTLPDGVAIVPFLDRTKMVNSAIGTVARNLSEGALIVIFVLVLMLGNWRAGFVVVSVIPLSLLFAISLMNVFGVSGNLMSLGAIDFGLIVDGAVIIVEATLHHLHGRMGELAKERMLAAGANGQDQPVDESRQSLSHSFTQAQLDEEVFDAAARIRSSAAFGEIIILIVYLPILALSGVEGKMFRPMALTVAFAILGAFILSLTYVPMASALFLDKRIRHQRTLSDRIMGRIQRVYEPILLYSLRHRIPILAAAVGLLVAGGWLFSGLGGEFLPTLDEGDFAIDTRTLTGSSLSETIDATLKAERLLLKNFPEVEQVVGKVGSGDVPTDPMSIEASDLMVILKPREEWTSASTRDELAAKMAETLADIPGVTFGFQQPVQMRFNELMTGARQDVGVKIYGDDLNELTRLAGQVGRVIRGIAGTSDLYVEPVTGIEQLLIQLDRPKLAQYGLNVSDVNRTINMALAGQVAGQVYEGEKRFDLVVRLEAGKRQSIDDIKNLFVSTPDGRQLPLAQIARVRMVSAPNQIQRDDTHRRITLGFNIRGGRDVESIVNELTDKVNQGIRLPPGYSVSYGGQFQNLIEAKQRLSIAVPVALLLIFSLLFFTFGSFKQSLMVFVAIPMAAIGGVFALVLRGMPFSISAGVGFIALFGVAVLNGIVLIAEFNRLRKEDGLTDMIEVIRRGAETRLRPVVMTALVASLGFIPMAVSDSAGAEVQKPLATVVIGGLITATLLTLLVLPILYSFFERIAENDAPGKNDEPNSPRLKPSATEPEGDATPDGRGGGMKPVSTLLVLLLLSSLSVFGQGPAIRNLSLEQALTEAGQRNGQLQLATLSISQQQALRPSAMDLGRTTLSATLGQYNTLHFDNNLTLSQTIPNPVLLRRQGQLIDATVGSRQAARLVTQNDLRYQVRATYYDLSYYDQRGFLFRQQDSVLAEFVQAAALRVRVGEAGSLEKATAETQRADQRVRIARNAADREAMRVQLQTLLQTPDRVDAPATGLPRLTLLVPTDSLALTRNPLLGQLAQQIVVAEQTRQVEQARRRPDFVLGLFSQTLIGPQLIDGVERQFGAGNRFWGGQVGVSLPLLAGPQRARIEAARIGEQIARTEQTTRQLALEQQLALAIRQYSAYRDALTEYEQTALPQAQLIQTNARRAFQGGDIGYVEFSLAIQQALTIRLSYLELLNLYNQSVLTVNYLVGAV